MLKLAYFEFMSKYIFTEFIKHVFTKFKEIRCGITCRYLLSFHNVSFAEIWDDIKRNKSQILERHVDTPHLITDITDGRIYRELLSEGGFLYHNCNITVLMNTDGLSLYSSSKVQLWPLFFAINELSPSLRFARENIILASIWQGKGKPPMQQYLGSLCSVFNNLYDAGIVVELDNKETSVKVKVIYLLKLLS